jgi:hypothetical protein
MRIFSFSILVSIALCSPLVAEVFTPAPDTPLRKEVLDAVRVPAIHTFGAPVEFHVTRLEVEGGVAFAMATVKRLNGVEIDLTQTPMFLRGEGEDVSEAVIQAFVKRVDGQWVVEAPQPMEGSNLLWPQYAIGSDGVWLLGPPYCEDYSAFIFPGACE